MEPPLAPTQEEAEEELPWPAGVPAEPGEFTDVIPVRDDRAVALFTIARGREKPSDEYIALITGKGRPIWVQTLPTDAFVPGFDRKVHAIGRALVVELWRVERDKDRSVALGHYAFAADDGAPLWHDDTGTPGQVSGSTSAFSDTRQVFAFAFDWDAESGTVVAYDDGGRQWAQKTGFATPVGYGPQLGRHHMAFREGSRGVTWRFLRRSDGRQMLSLPAEPQGCRDAKAFYILDAKGLVAVDDATLAQRRLVEATIELPGKSGAWKVVDCAAADDGVALLVRRGPRSMLAVVDNGSGRVQRVADLQGWSIGTNGFDPLPDRLPEVATFPGLHDQLGQGPVIVDTVRDRIVWHPGNGFGPSVEALGAPQSALLNLGRFIAVIDPGSGKLARAFDLGEEGTGSMHVFADKVWIAPVGPGRLGYTAPTILDPDVGGSDEARSAVLTSLELDADGRPRAGGTAPCPDPTAIVRGDGLGTAPKGSLGAVKPTRLPTWDLDILGDSARDYACAPGTARATLLAWYIIEDDRPLRNHHAAVIVEHPDGKKWTVVVMYRHATNDWWNISVSFHSRSEPLKDYAAKPDNEELLRLLRANNWTFRSVADWKILAGNVLDENWKAVTGQAPKTHFPKGIEQKN